jgi:Mor family transcriptional regulator
MKSIERQITDDILEFYSELAKKYNLTPTSTQHVIKKHYIYNAVGLYIPIQEASQ